VFCETAPVMNTKLKGRKLDLAPLGNAIVKQAEKLDKKKAAPAKKASAAKKKGKG
jgi:hypothetical protein